VTNGKYSAVDSPTPSVPTSVGITLNTNGFALMPGVGQIAYNNAQGGLVNTGINSGSPRALGFALLHELGHATGVLAPDLNNSAAEDLNQSLVAANCDKTIKTLSNVPSKP
jgi:hypothetical protein